MSADEMTASQQPNNVRMAISDVALWQPAVQHVRIPQQNTIMPSIRETESRCNSIPTEISLSVIIHLDFNNPSIPTVWNFRNGECNKKGSRSSRKFLLCHSEVDLETHNRCILLVMAHEQDVRNVSDTHSR